MKRLIAETIPLHTVDDDILYDKQEVTEDEFYSQVDPYDAECITPAGQDPYEYYLANREYGGESPADYTKKRIDEMADKVYRLQHDEEDFYLNQLREVREELKECAYKCNKDKFWKTWDIYSDLYKDVYGVRPYIDGIVSEETLKLLR